LRQTHFRSLSAGTVNTSKVPGAERSVALTSRVVAVYALNMVVHLATNTTTEARMTDQAVSKREPAQPTLTEDEPTGNQPAEEISIDGTCDAY
jgi:hypothetical protein